MKEAVLNALSKKKLMFAAALNDRTNHIGKMYTSRSNGVKLDTLRHPDRSANNQPFSPKAP